MILFFNIFLTQTPLKHRYDRGLLPSDSSFDVFKYCIASVAPIYDWSQVILNIKLDECFKSRQDELDLWIKDLFPNQKNFKLNFGLRNESQSDWLNTIESFIDDDLIFHSCNHDHIFLDSQVEYFRYCIEILKKREKERGIFTISHFAEMVEASQTRKYNIDGSILYLDAEGCESFVVTTKSWFKEWWETTDLGNERWIRSDSINVRACLPRQDFFAVPSRELFRHYDGYRNITVPNVEHFMHYFPPLKIPVGFFNKKMVINYDPKQRSPETTNIGFSYKNSATYPDGDDYHYLPCELPLIFRGKTSQIIESKAEFSDDFEARMDIIRVNLSYYTNKRLNKPSEIYDYYLSHNQNFLKSLCA